MAYLGYFSLAFSAVFDEQLSIEYSGERKRKEKNILVMSLIHSPMNQSDQFFAHLTILSTAPNTLNKRLLFIV
jgi:hypothetical protein